MRTFVSALLIPLCIPAFAADSALLNFVMPEAQFLGGIDVQKSKTSSFAKSMLDSMPSDFFEKIGLDPKRDLDEILFASVEAGGHGGKGIFVVRGRLNPSKISDALRAFGPSLVENRNGLEIFKQQGNNSGGFTLIGDHTALLGDLESVRAAVDRRNGGTRLDAARASRAQSLSQGNDVWMIASTPSVGMRSKPGVTRNNSGAPMAGLNGDFLKSVEQAAVGLRFVPGSVELNMEAQAKTEKDAGALADVVRFLTNMVQMNRDNEEARMLATALEGMQISQETKTLRIKIALPQEQLEKMMHGAPAARRKI